MSVHVCMRAWHAGKPAQVTYWVNEMSAALKALDPNHMVRVFSQHRTDVHTSLVSRRTQSYALYCRLLPDYELLR